MATLSQLLSEAKEAKNLQLPSKEIIEKIYLGYLDDKDNSWKKKKSFAPSGLFYGSGACARRWYLSFDGGMYDSKTTPMQLANMKNGIKSHERIQEAMLKSGVATEVEIEVKLEDPPIFGFADAKIVHDDEYVGEIKTTSHKNFEYRRNTNKIADYHLGQMLIYMYILGINKGIVIYESKDTNELHGITFEMTEEYREQVEGILEWCRKVWAMHQNEEMPARGFRKDSKVCKSCPVEERCDMIEGGIKVERLPFNI
jgi:CRISPR/Cas system-associated exonuclease Cas4 (RecB family)